MKRFIVLASLPVLSLGAACQRSETATPPAAASAPARPAAPLPKVSREAVLAHIKVLASDEYQGRAPGTKGEELTVAYLQEQCRTLGLQPGNPDGTYLQKVPLVGISGKEARPLTVSRGEQRKTFKWGDDVVAWTKHVADGASIEDSEIVFAGYGVEAPEFNWDDFKGVDVKGKTIVVL